MNKTAVRLLALAAGLLTLAAVMAGLAERWPYAVGLLVGALGCGAAALNFRNETGE